MRCLPPRNSRHLRIPSGTCRDFACWNAGECAMLTKKCLTARWRDLGHVVLCEGRGYMVSLRTKAGATTMLRQRESCDGIFNAVCSRANRVLGIVSRHRINSLMQGLCRTFSTCRPGLFAGALFHCAMASAQLRGFKTMKTILSVDLDIWIGTTVFDTTTCVPAL